MPGIDRAGRDAAGVMAKTGMAVREPIVIVNLVSALLLEVCILLRQFGVPLTDGQVDAINAVAGLLLLVAAALFGRKLTTPVADPRDKLGQPLTPDLPTGLPTHDLANTGKTPELPATTSTAAPLDAPPLPDVTDEVGKAVPASPPGTPQGNGGTSKEGRRTRFR